jgi:pimeloyl-ACP methyl ester carboxylesterase
MAETTETLHLPGGDITVTRTGSGPQLLLLHGGGGPASSLPFIEELAKHFEIIAPVHPGFAGTKIPDHFDGMPDLVFFYLDVIDALNLKDITLVGMSMGGWLAAELASISCANIKRLVLVDAVGVKHGGPTDRDIADTFGLPAPKLAELMWHDASRAPNPADLPLERVEMMAANRIALSLYTWEPYMHNPKLKHRLHRISVPTLLIWGSSDGLVPPDYGRAYAKLIPGAQFIAIPEAGHSPHGEQPAAFNAAFLDFVARETAA